MSSREADQVCSVEILMEAGSELQSRFRKREKQKGSANWSPSYFW
jgi:hypothetical protein